MDLRRLRFLREFEVRGTLGAVATALDYSPSAVSQQLAILEKEVGAKLLEKAGRGVRLTDAGRILAGHAGVLLAAADAAAADLASRTDFVRGTVRVSGLQSAARRLLVPAVARLAVPYPGIRAEVRELEVEDALPELRLGSVDLLISDEYDGHPRPRPAGLTFDPLYVEPLMLVLPSAHPLAAPGGPVAIAALRDEAWVASEPGSGHHTMVVGTCRSLGGFDPDLRHHCYDAEVQLELVRQAGAVGLLPKLTLPDADPAVAYREVAEKDLARRLFVVTREGRDTPALATFLSTLRDVASSLGDSQREADPRDAPAGRADP
ncbi:LysR family transcriptional regulator [Actinoplanes sp. OR16]|uniref:LysR family transcriptional regulator n=1 Tax=Actinoplanes sp. OR16 TaxID=946334 RepID=UPI000F6FABDC|nr:LysR family transcriptional regulator [Actinoplanes sp. OR16]BBH67685.1 LysR family transcriptional regulator [Actinoplanes sp. OR16]